MRQAPEHPRFVAAHKAAIVGQCHDIKELPGVECLTSLEFLTVSRCEIAELQGLEHLIYLEWLYVFYCEKLQFW